ncbi:T9SS type B sorting domain-containing protein [Chryseobacterium caseinilyticum]|uniref:T9SS type B sorting domain-containing protein n=1 Tax=Chryseobacterium caseinilyticum TaxID=2771428 RepID=A0ABR8ZEY5_9FLAO|nr:T9SS type B sorting domain-containing protein [Chryseobacterium caseinilyticum]MBD8083838.1 T9SS type B sorting domain-containing protein [Chryseobacterium caseinilyticum]
MKKLLFSFLIIFHISLFAQEDCATAINACGNSAINYTPSGVGNSNEALGGCLLLGEHHSVWYKFTVSTSGTLTFNITPTGAVDYDWAVYGPNKTCANRGAPVRCNYAETTGSTGLNMTNTNTSSTYSDSPYCRYLDVTAGQTYYLYIDNFSSTVYTFNLTWGGTATLASPFANSTTAPNPFIPPGSPGATATAPREISICGTTSTFNFSSLSAGILNGNSNFAVTYYTTANNAASGTNPITAPVTVNTTNTYYYNITYIDPANPNSSINGCKQTGSIVFRNKRPVVTISTPSNKICFGSGIILTSSSSTGNIWSTGETTASITVTNAGTYTVTTNNGICTSLPASITVTKESDPNVQIAGNLIVCGAPTQLTATANGTGNTYLWSTGSTASSISVSNAGTYTVTVKTTANCSYMQSVTVVDGVVPTVQNSILDQCSATSTALFNLVSAQSDISTTSGTGFDFYLNQADAIAGNTNFIPNPSSYSSGNALVYVRVKTGTCFRIAQLQLNVTVVAAPVITASSNTICFGGNVTLTSNLASGNLWSTGATSQSITVTAAGTYTLSSVNGQCSGAPASVTIVPEANPNVQISGNLIICETPSVLTASSSGSGNTYLWSTGSVADHITVSTAGTYTVTVKTPSNCEYTQSVVVSQGVIPAVQNASLSICSNGSTAVFNLTSAQANLSATSGVTFAYYLNQSDALAGNTNVIANPAAHSSGSAVIYVRIKSSACFKIAQLQLTVNVKPAPTISSTGIAICSGNPVTLTSSLPNGNLWSTGQTSQSIVVSTPGVYSLTNNDGICTGDQVSYTVQAGVDPNLQITGNLTFCQGSSNILTAVAAGTGNTYLWSNGVTTAANNVTVGGSYSVTVTTSQGCQYQKSVNVIMDPLIVVSVAAPGQITCTTPQVILDASSSVYAAGATLSWTASAGGNIVSGGYTLTPTVSSAGTYTLTITSATPQGCVKQASVNVTANTVYPDVSLISAKLKICKGESTVLTALGAATYTWQGLSGNGSTQIVSPAVTTTYSVTGTSANGCVSLTPANVTVIVVPEIESSLNDIQICKGDRGILNAGAGAGYTYLWNTGETTQNIYVTNAGNYSVVINNGTCTKTFSAVVSYISPPEIKEVTYKDPFLTINAVNYGNSALEYSIDGGVVWQASNVFTVMRNAQYSVRVRNKNNSCNSEVEYYTFFMSNTITPNHDGLNDVLDFTQVSSNKDFEGEIADRYGKVVYKINPKNFIWNGKYLGSPLPTGTYWYKISWQDRLSRKNVMFSGWILLKNRD